MRIFYHLIIGLIPLFFISRPIHIQLQSHQTWIIMDRSDRLPLGYIQEFSSEILSPIERLRWRLARPFAHAPSMGSSLLTGITTSITHETFQNFKLWNLGHLLAASGMNVSMFVLIGLLMLGRPRRLTNILVPLLGLLYFLCTGKEATVGRAFYFLLMRPMPNRQNTNIPLIFLIEALIFPDHLETLSYYLSLLAISMVHYHPKFAPWILPMIMTAAISFWNQQTVLVVNPILTILGILITPVLSLLLTLIAFIGPILPKWSIQLEWWIIHLLHFTSEEISSQVLRPNFSDQIFVLTAILCVLKLLGKFCNR